MSERIYSRITITVLLAMLFVQPDLNAPILFKNVMLPIWLAVSAFALVKMVVEELRSD